MSEIEQTNLDLFDVITEQYHTVVSDKFRHWLIDKGFFSQAASTKFHLAYEGGLFEHSVNVYEALNNLTQKLNLNWSRKESVFIIGMFHDLCKIDQYIVTADKQYKWNSSADPRHAIKSIALLEQFIDLTDEEHTCIEFHMGAFTDKSEWNKFSDAIKKYPNVLYTHTADMIASKIIEKD